MILNINKHQGQKSTQNNLLSSANFLQKNKICVNQVAQAHYTVQGVQMYGAAQIKALKQNQQRLRRQQGTPIQIKLYQISDDIDFGNEQPNNQKQSKKTTKAKNVTTYKLQNNSIVPTDKDQKKITAKQKMQKNNNVLSRLEKQRNKKNALQEKLSKLSKKYKEYFKGKAEEEEGKNRQQQEQEQQNTSKSSLCQSIKKITKFNKNQQDQQQQQQQNNEQQANQNQPKTNQSIMKKNRKIVNNMKHLNQTSQIRQSKFKKGTPASDIIQISSQKKASTKATSNKINSQFGDKEKVNVKSNNLFTVNQQNYQQTDGKNNSKNCKNGKKNKQKYQSQKSLSAKDQGSQCQFQEVDFQEQGLNLVGEIFKNRSTYSQKLGSAVHLLFK